MEPRDQMFPGTPTISMLRIRPMAMALFEKYGIDPWHRPQASIAEVCRCHELPWSRFASELTTLEVPGNRTDWRKVPIYHLLDHLRGEHKEFEQGYLPAIRYAQDLEGRRGGNGLGLLRNLAHFWPEFTSALMEHLREEEEFLFPKIMRHASALRNDQVDPDFNGGSLRKLAALSLLKHENRFKTDLDLLRDVVQSGYAGLSEPRKGRLAPLLGEFHNRLRDHSRLETDVLYPMAMEAEKKLYDRHIAGTEAGIGGGSAARTTALETAAA